MSFSRTPAGVIINDPEPSPTWALELLERGEDCLTWNAGIITARCVNGTYAWRETGRSSDTGHIVIQTELVYEEAR